MQSKYQIIEAVVNISEGQNQEFINALTAFINNIDNVAVVHVDVGFDANRTVLTLIGEVEAVFEGVEVIINYSTKQLDIDMHHGEHPRQGIVDVIPFIALEGITHEELLFLAKERLEEIGRSHSLPILYYGDLSQSGDIALFHLRKWNMKEDLGTTVYADVGPQVYHPTLGVSCATVRKLMTAYNMNLQSKDLAVAKKIARDLRALRQSKDQSQTLDTTEVRYLAWYMEDYDCCQISTNVYDVEAVSLSALYDHVAEVASRYDVQLQGSELIGLVSRKAIAKEGEALSEALEKLRLDSVRPFDLSSQILEEIISRLTWAN